MRIVVQIPSVLYTRLNITRDWCVGICITVCIHIHVATDVRDLVLSVANTLVSDVKHSVTLGAHLP